MTTSPHESDHTTSNPRRRLLLRGAGMGAVVASLSSRPALGSVLQADGPGMITGMCSPSNSHSVATAKQSIGYHPDFWTRSVEHWGRVSPRATFASSGFSGAAGVSSGMTLRDALCIPYAKVNYTDPAKGYTGGYYSCAAGTFTESLPAALACGLMSAINYASEFGYNAAEFIAAVNHVLASGNTACATRAGLEAALASLIANICQLGRESVVGGPKSCWDPKYFEV